MRVSITDLARALGLALSIAGALPAAAQSEAGEFAGFQRAAVDPRGGPVDALVWEALHRAPDRFGPPFLREVDAALLAAVQQRDWAQALQRVKQGASVLAQGPLGGNVLVAAAKAGQDELVRDWIRRGADLDRRDTDGFTPLGAAAFQGHPATVRLLLRAGADPLRQGSTGQPPFHLACIAGRTEVVAQFLSQGIDPEALNRDRENTLDVAAANGQSEVVAQLLAAGVDARRAGRR